MSRRGYQRRILINNPEDGSVEVHEVDQADATPDRQNQANIANTSTYNGSVKSNAGNLPFDPEGRTKQQGALQCSFDTPTAVTVYVDAELFVNTPNFVPTPTVDTLARPVAVVRWGVAGATHEATIDATPPRGKLSIVCEWVSVNICFEEGNDWFPGIGGNGISSFTAATFHIEFAEGVDPDFVHNTRLICSNNGGNAQVLAAHGIIATGPARLQSISAWENAADTGAGTNFLWLFDAATVAGVGIGQVIVWPLPASPGVLSVDVGQDSDLTFQLGIVWGVSSSPSVFTAVPAAQARVDATVLR